MGWPEPYVTLTAPVLRASLCYGTLGNTPRIPVRLQMYRNKLECAPNDFAGKKKKESESNNNGTSEREF